MKKIVRGFCVLAIILTALFLRLRAVDQLGIDYDEDDYLGAALHYAQSIRSQDLPGLVDYHYNYEHPPLSKLVYAIALLPQPDLPQLPENPPTAPIARSLPQPHFRTARLVSLTESVLETLALALVNPLAGLFLAINTWQIKYTSQVMLEPLPALTSLLAVLCYLRFRKSAVSSGGTRMNGWLAGSAVFLGLTAAAKYMYCIVGIAILIDWLVMPDDDTADVKPRQRLYPFLFWGLIALLVFFAANPHLWTDPLGRLKESLLFHGGYAQSEQVQASGFPPWQPLVWLSMPVPWHPGVFIIPLDLYISLFAVLGFSTTWKKQRVFAIWLLAAIIFLLLWPTKWPQYIIFLTAPLSICAAEGFSAVVIQPIRKALAALGQPRKPRQEVTIQQRWQTWWSPNIQAAPWLLPGVVVLAGIVVFPILFQVAMSLTDFSAPAIRDGLNGGVWREVWAGINGTVKPVAADLFSRSSSSKVHYAGPALLLQLLLGGSAEIMVFDIIWTILSVTLQLALGTGAALLLFRQGILFKSWWRSIFILPWAVPEFVGALMWTQVLDPKFGWLQLAANAWSQRADYPGAGSLMSAWQENPTVALGVLLLTATWYGFPFMMLAATAGLKMIPADIFDAAQMDGVGAWSLFRHITWPVLLPLVIPAILIRAIFAFNQFYLFYALNPPYPALTYASISFFFFSESGQYAVSAALNIFTLLLLIVMILIFNRSGKLLEGVTDA